MAEAIRIQGLAQFSRALRKMDADAPKALRVALNSGGQVIVDAVRPKFPRRSGRAVGTVKARATRTAVRVSEGGNRAPYVPWLDFGGRVGRGRSVKRPWMPEGRYLYDTYYDKKPQLADTLADALVGLIRDVGLEAD